MLALSILVPKALLPALLLAATAAPPPHPDFSGTWVPDQAASTETKTLKTSDPKLSALPPAPPQAISNELPTLRITHAEPSVVIEFLESNGNVISVSKLTTDGAENLNDRAGGGLQHRSTSRWDGNVLRTTWTIARGTQVVISGTDARERTSPTTMKVTTRTDDAKSTSESVLVYHLKPPAK